MTNDINHPQTNFWFGFAFGVVMTSGISFLLGTEKGRNLLKQILELSENFGEDIAPLIKKITEELGGKTDDLKNETNPISTQVKNIGSILQKIKFLSPNTQEKTSN